MKDPNRAKLDLITLRNQLLFRGSLAPDDLVMLLDVLEDHNDKLELLGKLVLRQHGFEEASEEEQS